MKVLMVGNFGTGWDGSQCDEEHIAKALEELGHQVERWQREDVGLGSSPDNGFDFVLIAQWNGYPENMVTELRKLTGAPVVYWAFDYQWDKNGDPCPEEWHLRLVEECDLFLTKEAAHLTRYAARNIAWLPQDFAPEFLNKPRPTVAAPNDICFTGSHLPWSPERTEILKAVDDNFNLTIYSVTPDQWKAEGFKDVRPAIMDHGLCDLYPSYKINLSIDWKLSTGYWSDRNAQIMCCGGFTLFRYVPMSESVFRDYVAYFKDEDDVCEKIQYYLDNPGKRQTIANRGWKYARDNLKVKNRVKDMLTIVENAL